MSLVRFSAVVLLGSISFLGACASAADHSGDESTGGTQSGALAGGCRTICPKCKPGEVCSMIACYLDCSAPTPCGPSKCNKGEVCCNESCGICTAPGDFCTDLYCEPVAKDHTCVETAMCVLGYHWSSSKCACLPDTHGNKPGSCTTDADCRLEADYCTSCACDALSTSQTLPACPGPGVRCLVDPCGGHTAACVAGTCSVL